MKHHPKGCGIKYFTKCPSQQLLKSMFTYKDGQLTGRFQVPGMERNYFAGKTIGTFDITNPLKCKKVLIEKVYSEKIEEATTLILDMQYKDMHSEISWLLQQAYLQTGTYHTSPKRNVNDLIEAFNLTEAKG